LKERWTKLFHPRAKREILRGKLLQGEWSYVKKEIVFQT